MLQIMVCGAGKIGRFVAVLLARTRNYQVLLVDAHEPDQQLARLCRQYPAIEFKQLSVTDVPQLEQLCEQHSLLALISCLHSELNIPLAQAALKYQLHYLNLSEDRETKARIFELASQATTAFVPQCGIAPGLVDVAAHQLMMQFDKLHSATLSVGALPQQVSNEIHYELSWSIDGLVNEYLNPCRVIEAGIDKEVPALSGLETLNLEGETYELFHTSGGLGSLADLYKDKLQELHYKTIRYQGHAAAMQQLFKKYHNDHQAIVDWFREHIPFTTQDMVVMYICVTGIIDEELTERSLVKRWFAQPLDGNQWTAIQWTTASEICAVCDMVLANPENYQGLIQHQDIDYELLMANRFMQWHQDTSDED